MAKTGYLGIQQNNQVLEQKVGGIPQAWYGAGLLSLWSKGHVGSNPTSRAILHLVWCKTDILKSGCLCRVGPDRLLV